MKLEKFTEIERQFAEENHNLIYTFLHNGNYSIEDYYNIVVFGFLKAVQVYHRRQDLKGKYSFSVVAWKYMKSEIGNHFRVETAKKRNTGENILSLDADTEDMDSLYNIVGGKSAEADILENAAVQEILDSLTDNQRSIVVLKVEGYSNTEICNYLQMASSTFYKEINRIKGILENLYL